MSEGLKPSEEKINGSDDVPKPDTKNPVGNRQRRRSSKNEVQHKVDQHSQQKNENKDPRGGSRPNSVSQAQKGGRANGRKDWTERKSQSQGNNLGKGDGPQNNHSDNKDHKRTRSHNSNNGKWTKHRDSARTASQTSTAEGYDFSDEYEMEEPFSDSDDDSPRQPVKQTLPIPRGRIRTLSGTVPVVGFSPKWGGPTMCLSCLEFFDLPEQVERFSEHLLKEHKIVVSEMGLIVDPKRYIEYWRQRFVKESVDKIFPKVEPQEGDANHGTGDYYFLMSETLKEDYELRQRLAMRRLEEALQCQQREREENTFHLQCIFCRYTARGNRAKIIHHLYMIHHLNLGSPDNLVFVTEYIEHLKEKMQRNECIYCEKVFSDKNTLMDHMRKRNHREVNPKNHYYDKFYIINYLELGKRWLDVLAEDFEDTMPTFQDSDEEDEDNSWCEWQEDNIDADETRVVCLLCEESDETAEALLTHMKDKHLLDLLKEIEDHKLDVYERMKLINYVRKMNSNAQCWICQRSDLGNVMGLWKHLSEDENPFKCLPDRSVWDTDEFLVPLFGNDHFLWMLESLLEEKEMTGDERGTHRDKDKQMAALVQQSQKNTVVGVIAEDLPELADMAPEQLDGLM